MLSLFVLHLQEVITDESVKKPEPKAASLDVAEQTVKDLQSLCLTATEGCGPSEEGRGLSLEDKLRVFPQEFEKDDDSNGHIDFVTAASVRVEGGMGVGGGVCWWVG